MTSARVVILGLVAAVLAGGVVGAVLGAAVTGAVTAMSAGILTAAVAAAVVGFLVALLVLRPRRAAAPHPAPLEDPAPRPVLQDTTEAAQPAERSTPAETTDSPPAADAAAPEPSLDYVGTDNPGAPAAASQESGSRPAPADREPEPMPVVTPGAVLVPDAILLEGRAGDRDAAIGEVGRLLVESGAVEEGYVDSMRVRENSVSTFMGSQLAIPHGTTAAKALIKRSAVAVVRYPDQITWHGNPVKYVVAIAGAGDDHLKLVSKVAEVFLDGQAVLALENAQSAGDVLRVFSGLNATA